LKDLTVRVKDPGVGGTSAIGLTEISGDVRFRCAVEGIAHIRENAEIYANDPIRTSNEVGYKRLWALSRMAHGRHAALRTLDLDQEKRGGREFNSRGSILAVYDLGRR
jgi:hypothetical protein